MPKLNASYLLVCLYALTACAQPKANRTTANAIAVSAATSNPAAKNCAPLVPDQDLATLAAFDICSTTNSSIVKITYMQAPGQTYCVFPASGSAAPGGNVCFITDSSGQFNVQWPGTSYSAAYLVTGSDETNLTYAIQDGGSFPNFAFATISF